MLNSPPPLTKGCGRRRVAAISGVRIATYATQSDSVPGWRCVEGRAALVRGGVLLWVGCGCVERQVWVRGGGGDAERGAEGRTVGDRRRAEGQGWGWKDDLGLVW